MSICRFSEDSDVYLYETEHGFECCRCSIGVSFIKLTSTSEAVMHVEKHIIRGDKVPDGVIEALRQYNQS